MGGIIPIIALSVTIILSQYVYSRLLNYNKVTFIKYVSSIVFSILLAYSVHLLREALPYFRFALMVPVLTSFLSVIFKTKFVIALTSTIISTGISYGALLISSVASISVILTLTGESYDTAAALAAFILQSVMIICLFKIKRFKKGVTFLKSTKAGSVGLIISGILVLIIVIVNSGIPAERGGWAIIGTALCVVGLIVWWRHGLTKQYRERVKERNTQEFENIIAEKDQQIKKLQEDNELMSSIIHRDNKLLPSLAVKVELFMKSEPFVSPAGKQILKQVEQLFEERAETIKRCSYDNTVPLLPGSQVIDGVLNHMMMRASEEGIQFEIAEKSDFAESIESTISSIKLQTILADLIENAINATVKSESKRVFVSFSVEDGIYELNVQDSGKPFEAETLKDLGIKKTTTRLKEGGSGIGYMTIFEILRECNASLIITEYLPGQSLFTKSITVRFDNRGKHILITGRAEEIKDSSLIVDFADG